MKITLLLAYCTSELFKHNIELILNILKELDVEVHKIDLAKLPYGKDKKSRPMDMIIESIEVSRGVIAITPVTMLSMHSSLLNFFEQALEYENSNFSMPLLAITQSDWLGGEEAAYKILKSWGVLGGIDGGKICLSHLDTPKSQEELLERSLEDFYRQIKREPIYVVSPERQVYLQQKGKLSNNTYNSNERIRNNSVFEEEPIGRPEIRTFAEIIKSEAMLNIPNNNVVSNEKVPEVASKETVSQINLSTKEQTIKEIASLIEKEIVDGAKVGTASGVYSRPIQAAPIVVKRLQKIPHYFVAQHDKSLKLVLKYVLTDVDEEGYIDISEGDCHYKASYEQAPNVEMMMSEEVLESILSKKITYQKAFMLGKLKVKGNFAILPKLDQVFKAL